MPKTCIRIRVVARKPRITQIKIRIGQKVLLQSINCADISRRLRRFCKRISDFWIAQTRARQPRIIQTNKSRCQLNGVTFANREGCLRFNYVELTQK